MKKKITKTLLVLVALVLVTSTKLYAQEFAIENGKESTFPGGGAFDGTNFLTGIIGDSLDENNINVQLISLNGEFIGERKALGHKGGSMQIAFDGTNYFLVWNNFNWNPLTQSEYDTTTIYGQFMNTTAELIGNPIKIASGIDGRGFCTLNFENNTFLVTYLKGGKHQNHLYGQRLATNGTFQGAPLQISSTYARECASAFDGTNYLITWVEGSGYPNDRHVYGQFVSPNGALVGSNFLIDGGNGLSDNPVSASFDGTRFLVAFHEQARNKDNTDNTWNLYARFITKTGVVDNQRVTICDSTQNPMLPLIAHDGTNYLISWLSNIGPNKPLDAIEIKGRFFNNSGLPIGEPFSLFKSLNGKFPMGGVSGFFNNNFLVGAVRLDSNFTNGDIYVKLVPSSTLEVLENKTDLNETVAFPNPNNGVFQVKTEQVITSIHVYDQYGRLLETRLNPSPTQTNFDLSNEAKGLYFLKVTTDKGVKVLEVLKD